MDIDIRQSRLHTAGATGSIPVPPTNLGSSEGQQELPEAKNPNNSGN
jgi:hypothetical protein